MRGEVQLPRIMSLNAPIESVLVVWFGSLGLRKGGDRVGKWDLTTLDNDLGDRRSTQNLFYTDSAIQADRYANEILI
jgi:hypothetical protein